MSQELLTLADCDRISQWNPVDAEFTQTKLKRATTTIRTLAAALAESVRNCGECDGSGHCEVLDVGNNQWLDETCDECTPHRELLAKIGVKL